MTTNPHVPSAEVKVGTPLRDAAVDPRPEDFLPPTNAGKADPHGPLVVAPEIHASGTQPVRPGPVHVDDVKAQERAETEQAVKLLVERQDVGAAIPTADGSLGSRGPLGLSDPGSVPGGLEKAAAEEASAGADDSPAEPLRGQALDDALTAAGLPKTGTADEKRARLAEHTA